MVFFEKVFLIYAPQVVNEISFFPSSPHMALSSLLTFCQFSVSEMILYYGQFKYFSDYFKKIEGLFSSV